MAAIDPIHLVEKILARFQDSWEWAEVAPDVLRMLAEGLGLDRAYMYRAVEKPGAGLTWHFIADWTAPGLKHRMDAIFIGDQTVDQDDPAIADWISLCRRGEILKTHVRDTSGVFRDAYDALEIKSFISMPIHLNRRWWGHIGLADCRQLHEFSEAEISTLRIVARLFADAIEMSGSAIALSEQTRNTITEALPDGLILIDELGAIADANPAAIRLMGASRYDLIGQPFSVRAGLAGLATAALPEFGQRVETSIQRPDGASRPVELTLTEIKSADRRLTAASLRDLSAIKAAEAEIERQRDRLNAAQRDAALGSLLAGVAHELNNPLAVVVAQTTLLDAKLQGSPHAERISKIRAAADRCGRIIKSFLAMAKRATPTRRSINLDETIRAAVEMTAYGFKSAGIDLTLNLAGNLPEIQADSDQITQVMANLLINAQQAMLNYSGPREVRVGTRRDGGDLVIEISDSGPGVPEDLRLRIFDPYFTTKPVGAGTGIGLSVSRSMIIAHGGTLELDSRDGEGARFVIRLPLSEEAKPEPVDPVTRAVPRVLIVDDEEDVGSSLADILEMLGANPEVVTTTSAALVAEPADIVCSDLRMPGGGGLKLYADLVARYPALKNRFILVTGDTVTAAGEVAAAGHADTIRILEKPFTIPDVRRIWAEVWGS